MRDRLIVGAMPLAAILLSIPEAAPIAAGPARAAAVAPAASAAGADGEARTAAELADRVAAVLAGRMPKTNDTASATATLVEAFQWAARHRQAGTVIRSLLAQPEDLAIVLDSQTLPIRVSYATPADEDLAVAVLAAAENSWTTEVGYGFTAPPIATGTERYRFFIESTGGYGGAYTAPIDWNEATVWDDCLSYIVVDPGNWLSDAGYVVAHEMSHAMQMAADCLEPPVFMENTSTYIMSQVYPDDFSASVMFMPYFQGQPWRGLSYMNMTASDLYEYGGALWAIFLAETYAPTAGPALLAEIWDGCRQNDYENEPDYFDVIPEVVAAHGGPDSLDSIFLDFSEARFFVASRDDGAHLARAADMDGAELQLTSSRGSGSLPLTDISPSTDRRPEPYGSNHHLLMLGASGANLRIDFDGDEGTRWAVRVLLLGDEGTEAQDVTLDPSTGTGSLTVTPAGHAEMLLVIGNLGNGRFDPDASRPKSSYLYSVTPLAPPPVITAVSPAEVEQGAERLEITISGENFRFGDGFGVSVDDPSITVTGIYAATATEIRFTVSVAADAPIGPHALTVTNTGGDQVTMADALTVVAAPPDEPGCGCAVARRPRGAGGAVLGALGLAVAATCVRVRRRRQLSRA